MPVSVYLAASAIAASIPLMWWSVASSRRSHRVRDNLASLGGVRSVGDVRLSLPATDRFVGTMQRGLAERVRRITPTGVVESLDRRLALSGVSDRWTVERLLAAKGLCALLTFAFGLLRAISSGTPLALLLAVGGAGIAFLVPDIVLTQLGDKRQLVIRDELPDIIDQMVISVEAGLSFDGALDRVARKGEGPMAQELMRVLQDIALGLSRSAALENLVQRTNVDELRELVLALTQAEAHGLSIAEVLRVQADELRDKRKARAEERAMKIPVKITVPLILCIFPALLVVIVGPAVVRIAETGGFGG